MNNFLKLEDCLFVSVCFYRKTLLNELWMFSMKGRSTQVSNFRRRKSEKRNFKISDKSLITIICQIKRNGQFIGGMKFLTDLTNIFEITFCEKLFLVARNVTFPIDNNLRYAHLANVCQHKDFFFFSHHSISR